MLATIGQMLPVALAAALSSVPITIMLLILLSPRRKSTAIPFMIGCVLGMAIVVTVATLAAQALPPPRKHRADPGLGVVEILLGATLVVLGVVRWHRHLRSNAAPKVPSWASAVDLVGPVKAFGIGVVMGFRPKNILLATVIGLQLYLGSLKFGVTVALGACYVILATSTITVPVLLTILAPAWAEPRLGAAAKTLAADGPVVSAVVMLVLGVVVIGAGLQTF